MYINKKSFLHFRAIDFQALIGNIGGYIGLLLGYSLLQIPDLINWVMLKSNRYFDKSSDKEHNRDQHTKGKDVKHPTSHRNRYKRKMTYSDHFPCNRCSFSRRETNILERIKSLEQARDEMIKMKF